MLLYVFLYLTDMQPILNQSELEAEILRLEEFADSGERSLRVSDIKSASPFVLAVLSSAKIVLGAFGDRSIEIGNTSLSPSEIIDLLIAGISGIAKN
jgi:hypothetical protein